MTLKAEQLEVGEQCSVINYYTITGVNDNRKNVDVTDIEGNKLSISFNIVANECVSATQHSSTKKVTRTEIARKVAGAGHTIFTVTFLKQPSIDSVLDTLQGEGGDVWTKGTKKRKREVAKSLLEGEERGMVATLVQGAVNDMGRLKVMDMEKSPPAVRMIDTRTINKLILDNVLYTVV